MSHPYQSIAFATRLIASGRPVAVAFARLSPMAAGTKKAGIARFLLSPRLLPAAGTFMVGEPSIGSNTITACENLTSYPEGYLR